MIRFVLVGLLSCLVGCGGGGEESYSAKALDEFRAGNAADYLEKSKKPTEKAVSEISKRMKKVTAGTREDFLQGLWILSTARDQDRHLYEQWASSRFVRTTYIRVFGKPDEIKKNDKFTSWSHDCSNGKVSLRGHYQIQDDKKHMLVYPPKG